MTGKVDEADKAKFIDTHGFASFVTKPVSADHMRRILAPFVRMGEAQAEAEAV